MVKLNQKSKRINCSKRYKIEKRIRDHNKKIRKDSKNEKKIKKNIKKTFQIPNKFPMKEELLQTAEKQKIATLELKKKKKEQRKKLKEEGKIETIKGKPDPFSLEQLLTKAQKKQKEFEESEAMEDLENETKDPSLKAFYQEFNKVIESSDVLIEVLDARDPIGSRCTQMEEIIAGKNKKLVLLLNKIDLVPKENVQAWLIYLRGQYPTVAFKSSTQHQNDKLSQSSVPVDLASQNLLNSSKCLGADVLVKLLKNYTRTNDIKQTIAVGIIGRPNVGKSSVINSLKRSNACSIGSVPGLTRCMKEIKLDKNIKLLDCPGIVMSKEEDTASLALKNCLKIEKLEDPFEAIELLLKKCNKDQLVMNYKITDFKDASDFLCLVAKRYGKMKKNGIPDVKKAAHLVLNDWNYGRLVYYTPVPKTAISTDTKLVNEFSKAFNIDEILDEEAQFFKKLDDTSIIVNGMEIMDCQ